LKNVKEGSRGSMLTVEWRREGRKKSVAGRAAQKGRELMYAVRRRRRRLLKRSNLRKKKKVTDKGEEVAGKKEKEN